MNVIYLLVLGFISSVLGVVLILDRILISDKGSLSSFPYRKRDYFFTTQEKKFYSVLNTIAKKNNLVIFSKVRIIDLIYVRKTRKRRSYVNKVISKHIDFVLLNQELSVLCCIELDDPTHNRPSRIKRDKFVNELFEKTGVPLIRIKTRSAYTEEDISKRLYEFIN